MTDSDSETKALIQSPPKKEYLNESDETTTTDDECDEIHVDCPDFAHFENFGKEVQKDPLNQQQSSSDISSLKLDKAFDAVHYFAKDIQSSSDSSGKVSSTASSVELGCTIEYTTDEFGNSDYVDIDFNDYVGAKHIGKLMTKLRLNHYTAISVEGDFTLTKCKRLFERDYSCEIIENPSGNLSKHYPPRLIIPVAGKSQMASFGRLQAVEFDPKQYRERVAASVSSRLMTRFAAPVIMFDNKFICRAGTLTVRKSAVLETARQNEPPKDLEMAACVLQERTRRLANALTDLTKRGRKAASQLLIPNSIEKLRDVDAEILRNLNIQHVCDLMIETRKMFKQAVRISSSEKINKGIYSDCAIEQMPYPGNKLFQKYHEANHKPEGLIFDWTRRDLNVAMLFSEDPSDLWPDVNWENYKEWDLVNLTKNYLKMILTYLARDQGGLLVHCVSGWDRTPLFISMLRVSLWADGVIHESLNHMEMAYLTLAYDWYLFGHDLPNRMRKNQEIMHFCFKFLEYISTDEFSITRIFHQLPLKEKEGRDFPDYLPGRRNCLDKFSAYVLKVYDEFITKELYIS